jgi:hypothetical protein
MYLDCSNGCCGLCRTSLMIPTYCLNTPRTSTYSMLISPRVPRTQVRSVINHNNLSPSEFRSNYSHSRSFKGYVSQYSTVLVQEQNVRMNRFPILYSYTAGPCFRHAPEENTAVVIAKVSSMLEPLTQTQTRTTDHSSVRSLLGAWCRCCSSCSVVDSTLILLAWLLAGEYLLVFVVLVLFLKFPAARNSVFCRSTVLYHIYYNTVAYNAFASRAR